MRDGVRQETQTTSERFVNSALAGGYSVLV